MTFAAERGFQPVIIGMEQLDAEACMLLNKRFSADCPIFLSSNYDGFFLTELLRSLKVLVTSRYHAQVLATGSYVPTVAVSMDERLVNLSDELGTSKEMLLHVDDPDLAPRLLLALDYAQDNADEVRGQLSVAYQDVCDRLDQMGLWLSAQLSDM